MDMKVFVDADPDVRLSRRSANFYFCFVLFFFLINYLNWTRYMIL